MRFVQDLGGNCAATSARRADAELHRQLLKRAAATTRAFAHVALGDGIADADVHDGNDYHTYRQLLSTPENGVSIRSHLTI